MGNNGEIKREYLTVKEVSGILGVSVFTIYTHIREKRIRVRRAGRAIRIHRADLEKYLTAAC